MNENIKLVYCYFGRGIALGAYGDKEVVERTLNQLYNFGGHDTEPVFMGEGFAYVLTSKANLRRGVANILRQNTFETVSQMPRGETRKEILEASREDAKEKVEEFMSGIPIENFLTKQDSQVTEYSFYSNANKTNEHGQ